MWHQDHIGLSMTRYAVVPLLQAATESILQNKPGLIGNGFRKAGLFPWNTDAVDMTRMGPSAVYQEGTRSKYYFSPNNNISVSAIQSKITRRMRAVN